MFDCAICLDTVELGGPDKDLRPAVLLCGHGAHYGCLQSHFTSCSRAPRCHICRREYPPGDLSSFLICLHLDASAAGGTPSQPRAGDGEGKDKSRSAELSRTLRHLVAAVERWDGVTAAKLVDRAKRKAGELKLPPKADDAQKLAALVEGLDHLRAATVQLQELREDASSARNEARQKLECAKRECNELANARRTLEAKESSILQREKELEKLRSWAEAKRAQLRQDRVKLAQDQTEFNLRVQYTDVEIARAIKTGVATATEEKERAEKERDEALESSSTRVAEAERKLRETTKLSEREVEEARQEARLARGEAERAKEKANLTADAYRRVDERNAQLKEKVKVLRRRVEQLESSNLVRSNTADISQQRRDTKGKRRDGNNDRIGSLLGDSAVLSTLFPDQLPSSNGAAIPASGQRALSGASSSSPRNLQSESMAVDRRRSRRMPDASASARRARRLSSAAASSELEVFDESLEIEEPSYNFDDESVRLPSFGMGGEKRSSSSATAFRAGMVSRPRSNRLTSARLSTMHKINDISNSRVYPAAAPAAVHGQEPVQEKVEWWRKRSSMAGVLGQNDSVVNAEVRVDDVAEFEDGLLEKHDLKGKGKGKEMHFKSRSDQEKDRRRKKRGAADAFDFQLDPSAVLAPSKSSLLASGPKCRKRI